MKIGYQGIAGSYSEAATLQYLARIGRQDIEGVEMVNFHSFPDLTQSVIKGEIDYAMMPVENSTTGLITRTLDLFRKQPVIGGVEVFQPVQHTLWGIEGATIEGLKQVYSHPEALSQCASFFNAHPWIQPIAYTDTAESALLVSQELDPTIASLSSPTAGALYGLSALKERIQSEVTNTTRFFLMEAASPASNSGQHLEELAQDNPERTRMMLYVETPHEPGALAKLLNTFSLFDCNLEALDARPIVNQPFKYGFFIEVDISSLGISREVFWQTLEYASNYIQLIACFQPVANSIEEVNHGTY